MSRFFYMALAWSCVTLGFIGVFLPLLPTTPFLLVALWAFARSSPKLAAWLENHPLLGRYVRDWAEHRAVPVSAKVIAVLMMSASFTWLAAFSQAPIYAVILTGVILLSVAAWLVTRPSPTSSE